MGAQRPGAMIRVLRDSIPITIALAICSGWMGRRKKLGNAVSFIRVASSFPPKATLAIAVAVQPG
ncbi:hypothetical protein D9M71_716650 [compost metagenome]